MTFAVVPLVAIAYVCNATFSVRPYPEWRSMYLATLEPVTAVSAETSNVACNIEYNNVNPPTQLLFENAVQFVESLYLSSSGCILPVITLELNLSPKPSGDSYTVGTADLATNLITLYTERLENDQNMLYLVAVHEIMHLIGFNEEFRSRVTNDGGTRVYNSDAVNRCLRTTSNPGQVSTDDLYHWASTESRFSLMKNELSSSSYLAPCSVVVGAENAQLESLVCTDSSDCPGNSTCRVSTPYLSVCSRGVIPATAFSNRQPYTTFPVFFTVVLSTASFIVTVVGCAKKNHPGTPVASVIRLNIH
jgi:hypothetical protein